MNFHFSVGYEKIGDGFKFSGRPSIPTETGRLAK